ncbi:DUF4126 domain-containing protein [Desulfobacula sp.]|uniref:DUF4126 domain-containing protein n=1 Tax=Desulfobacula sp. TaxID=2593537 RepID=UPI00262C92CA|nr:DUF4126 domain-containing protein [Desulfobacula sp.]
MDDFNQIIETISLTMGAAWGSGINLYATILVLGFLGMTDNIVLPQSLEILMNPLVIGAAGVMYFVEFIADKIPGVDTGWDTLHTFVRIPAGVLLAAGAVGDVNPAVAVAAGILGGGLSASTHAAKSGTRLLINTSPEPVSNWTASVLEDVAVITGVWAALVHPWVFLVILILFIFLMIWFLPRLWGAIKKFFAFLGRIFGVKNKHRDLELGSSGDLITEEENEKHKH